MSQCPICTYNEGWVQASTRTNLGVTYEVMHPCPRCNKLRYELWAAGAYNPDVPSTKNNQRMKTILNNHGIETR